MITLSPIPPQRQMAPVITNDRPAYMITDEKGFYGPDDRLYNPGELIYWDEEPNQNMNPLNDKAREAMKKYLAKLDGYGRKMAEKNGRMYTGLEDAFQQALDSAQQDAKRVQVITELPVTPLMGAKKDGHKKVSLIDNDIAEAPLLGSPKSAAEEAKDRKIAAMAKARAAKTSKAEKAGKDAVNDSKKV